MCSKDVDQHFQHLSRWTHKCFWPANVILFNAHLDLITHAHKTRPQKHVVLFVQYGRSDKQKEEGERLSTLLLNKK